MRLTVIQDKISVELVDMRKEFPNISNDFWNEYPGMLDTFRKKFPGISDAFVDQFSEILDSFWNKAPGMWDYVWDESPWMLKIFQENFPGMSDDFLKVFSWILGRFLKATYTDNMLCINYQVGNACKGDSGGSLVTKPPSADGISPGQNYELIGATSFSTKMCNAAGWTVYARVTSILTWIKKSVGTDHTNCPRE